MLKKPIQPTRKVTRNEISNWTDNDEALLQKLVRRRKATKRGDATSDLSFVSSLLDGEEAEALVTEALQYAEIKRDKGVGNTKKVFVEHESYGKPSGLGVTESDYWIFVLDGQEYQGEVFIGIHTDRLRRIHDSIKWEVRGGDNKASKGKLIPLSSLIRTNTILEKQDK